MFNKSNNWQRFHPAKIFMYMIFFVGFMLAIGWVVMKIWNWVITDLTGWKAISYWQAVGLLVLFRILFGGVGRRGPWKHHKRHGWIDKWHGMSHEEKRAMKEKWRSMSREEKMQMKEKWKDWCRKNKN